MENNISNPSAFACASSEGHQAGMKLRDYFAAKALNGIHSNHEIWKDMSMDRGQKPFLEYIAENCYDMADAMLKAREK